MKLKEYEKLENEIKEFLNKKGLDFEIIYHYDKMTIEIKL